MAQTLILLSYQMKAGEREREKSEAAEMRGNFDSEEGAPEAGAFRVYFPFP